MSDETAVRLHTTTDAQVWAKEWIGTAGAIVAREGTFVSVLDEGWMIGWFANAIETGRNHGRHDTATVATEALGWALNHHANQDEANAAIHCAPVRYSPITFRLATALASLAVDHPLVEQVIMHKGTYDEDRGR